MYMAVKLQVAICYNPQANGQIEKVRRVLTVNITSVLNPHGSEWLNVLLMIKFAYNNIYQSTIKSILPSAYCLQALPKFALSHVKELVNRAVRVKDLSTYNVAEDQEYQPKRAKAKTLRPNFKIGQNVLIHREVYQMPYAGDKFQF